MPSPTDATATTVSQPLSLSAQTGVQNGDAGDESGKRSSRIKPELKVTLTSLTVNNLGTLKKIISVVCPQQPSASMYKTFLDPSLEDINKLIYYGDIPVGAIVCQIAPKSKDAPASEEEVLQIQALAILAPYRSLSLGHLLLTSSLRSALLPFSPVPATKTAPAIPGRKAAGKARAYVREDNEEALRFWKREGFGVVRLDENYYKDQTPTGGYLMEKVLTSA